jgi:hypothetical protein
MCLQEQEREEAALVVDAANGDAELLLFLDAGALHPRHVGRRKLGVPVDERRVPRGLWQLRARVEAERGRQRADHEDGAPYVIGLWQEGGQDEVDGTAEEDADTLHGVDGGNEGTAGALVGVLRNDGRAQRVGATEPEPEEA